MNRPKCSIKNCNNIVTSKGHRGNGKKRYRKLCSTHYKLKMGQIYNLDTSRCPLCNWQGPCDRHRLIMGRDGGRYIKGNVIVLCPNCHRLLHLGKLLLK